MLYIYQISNKWKQAEDLFNSFVRSGCNLGTERLGSRQVFPSAGGLGLGAVREGGTLLNCCFSIRRGKSMRKPAMKPCTRSGKKEIELPPNGVSNREKRVRHFLLHPTRLVTRMHLLVIWTEFRGENRSIFCLHPPITSASPRGSAKYPHARRDSLRQRGTWGRLCGEGNGRWRPHFFTAKAVPSALGFRAASPCSRVATARSSPLFQIHLYYAT